MSVSINVKPITFVSSEALTIHRFVALTAAGLAEEANDALGLLGVCQETVAAGVSVPVQTMSGAVVQIELAGTLAAGARVMSNATGQAIAEATAGSLGAGVLRSGGVSGDIVELLYQPVRRFAV